MSVKQATRKLSFDSDCRELAVKFLKDRGAFTKEQADDLAQDIQDAIENWFFADELPEVEG